MRRPSHSEQALLTPLGVQFLLPRAGVSDGLARLQTERAKELGDYCTHRRPSLHEVSPARDEATLLKSVLMLLQLEADCDHVQQMDGTTPKA